MIWAGMPFMMHSHKANIIAQNHSTSLTSKTTEATHKHIDMAGEGFHFHFGEKNTDTQNENTLPVTLSDIYDYVAFTLLLNEPLFSIKKLPNYMLLLFPLVSIDLLVPPPRFL